MHSEDGIRELIVQANSKEELLRELDTEQRKFEIVSALQGEGQRYELNSNLEFEELDTLTIGIGLKLYEYLHQDPPEDRPMQIRH